MAVSLMSERYTERATIGASPRGCRRCIVRRQTKRHKRSVEAVRRLDGGRRVSSRGTEIVHCGTCMHPQKPGFFGAPPLPSPPAGHTHRRLQQGGPAGGGLSLGPSYRMGGPGIEPSPHPLHRTPTCRRGVGCQLSHVALATVERWLVGLRPVRGVEDASPLAGERLG